MCIKVVKIYIQMKINNLCQYLFLVTPLENKFLAQVDAGWWTQCLVVLHNPRQAFAGLGWTVLKITQAQFPKTVSFSKIQIGHALGYLNNREDVLKDSGENVPFFGNGSDQKYCDEKAPLMIDFVNHGGSRPGIIAFDEIDEQQSPTHPSSDDWNWRSSFKRNFDRLNSFHIQRREISRSYSQRNYQNNVSPKYIRGCHASGDHNHFVKRSFT